MLHALIHYFSLTRYTKIFNAGRKSYIFNTQVSVFIDVWRLHAAIPCAFVANIKFQVATGGKWKSSKRHTSLSSIVFGSLFSLCLVFSHFSVQTKPNKTLHLTVSRSEQNQTFQR